jgi:hypothetical protein
LWPESGAAVGWSAVTSRIPRFVSCVATSITRIASREIRETSATERPRVGAGVLQQPSQAGPLDCQARDAGITVFTGAFQAALANGRRQNAALRGEGRLRIALRC